MGRMKRLNELKILIIGYGRHGKDTVAEMLRDNLGMKFTSSSQACSDYFIFDRLKDRYGYSTSQECFDDRHNHRTEWFQLIQEYNSKDKTRLARNILEHNHIYVGMRCERELEACNRAKIFDHIVWVDASKRLPPESTDSNTITEKDADYTINNNFNIEWLDFAVQRWLNKVTHK